MAENPKIPPGFPSPFGVMSFLISRESNNQIYSNMFPSPFGVMSFLINILVNK